MVTIRDVARLAGVSPATVSQALNGRGRVDVRTRERVAQAATKLRYAPNLSGRRLARRRAECVAVVQGRNMTTVFSDSFYRVVLCGMAEVTQARGYSLVFTPPPADAMAEANLDQVLGHGAVDGALVLGAVDAKLLLALRHRGLPLVLVDDYVPGVDLPAVTPDYQAGARLATGHLLRLGHRRIALLGAAVSYPFGWQTLEGYGEALAQRAIGQDLALVRRIEISVEAATAATRSLLALPDPPTALFAVTDAMAIGALRAARERGVRVPAQLAVVGMDDIEMSAYTDPPLTTVRIGKDAMGRLAADWLIALIERETDGRPGPSVPAELIVRASCGGPAAQRDPQDTISAGIRLTVSSGEDG
jgi:LacI family transcriptional regulator, repressor for deo operon, udp, cdd, tsx, nupC, and nupG